MVPQPPPDPPAHGSNWPVWESPSEADFLELARVLTPFIRFLKPEIVASIVEDNEQHREEWSEALRTRDIDPDGYLWERCATTFPGIRRHVGGTEIDRVRGGQREGFPVEQALRLDDNDYPKQIWSFTLRGGRRFAKSGPGGYELAHLLDHKAKDDRLARELCGPVAQTRGPAGLPGLFTSVGNTVYVHKAFVRPTDFSPQLRNLLQRKAEELYEGCQIVPGRLNIRVPASAEWYTSNFDWAEPVGNAAFVPGFLEYRLGEMNKLLNPMR